MLTVEAVVGPEGAVHLLEPVRSHSSRRALVTILDETPMTGSHDVTLLSEPTLGEDWNRPEEDAAWSHLQKAR